MHPRYVFSLGLLICLVLASPARAQQWGRVEGRVTNATTGAPIPGATVLVAGTNFGTATDAGGGYALRLPEGRYVLRYSSVGFHAQFDTVRVRESRPLRRNVALAERIVEMQGVIVEETPIAVAPGAYTLTPEEVEDIPAPFDGFRALKVLPGVATNNELSSQYSVRGGGYNENLIFINGFEVYMPFRPRQGEQEGLGLLNPALAERITLYTGGFPARYGGKLSSALEVVYREPEGALAGSASVSLLDAEVNAGASALDGRLRWLFGFRTAQADRFFGTQELKGDYDPQYTDLQGALYFDLTPGLTLELLGIWADHEFKLAPGSKRTYYGAISLNPRIPSNFKSLYTDYEGLRTDGYTTRFLGGRLTSRLSPSIEMDHALAYFGTEEREQFDIRGRTALLQVDPASGEGFLIGTGRLHEKGNNRVRVSTLTGRGRYRLTPTRGGHAFEAGWHLRGLRFEDRIDESATSTTRGEDGRLVTTRIDGLNDHATFHAWQAGLYVQDAMDLLPEPGRLLLTAGMRADYFSFNDEWTLSPRLSARYQLTDDTRLSGSLGVYHQKPTYREFRGKPQPGDTTLIRLNRNLKSQRSVQFVFGGEHFFPEERLYLRAEVYYKHLTHLISYDIENVRVLYSGFNDARGFTYGLDVQLRGELVPGLESWFNYSYMVSKARFLPEYRTKYNAGLVPRPADQRHTFSAFIQDYVPGDKTWKVHVRALFGSGLPYTPPVPGEAVTSTIRLQRPGPRNAFRLPQYRRVDVGVTKLLTVLEKGISRPVRLELTAEILNLFDMVNTVAFSWDGNFNRTPIHLTPRTINVRLQIEF